MVEIEGNPRLQIACNTQVTNGMVINNSSPKVKDAVKWGLDFHLINHPLDCPICDQAGECGLQDQYMAYGKYDPEMAERKVKKHKVVDLGPRVVLDSERCILCSRCVRFCNEVTKTDELGIFNRGDHAEIGTFDGRPLANNYSLNTVDICPVGALTSRDFRFRQRVWLLKDQATICTGCSTGCNVKMYYNKEGVFRVKPEFNADVNGHWMCDTGRDTYKFVNRDVRMLDAKVSQPNRQAEWLTPVAAARKVGEHLRSDAVKAQPSSVALVLTGQYSNEEYESVIGFFKSTVGTDQIYHWVDSAERKDDFDGLLLRGDRNPNTRGLVDALENNSAKKSWAELEAGLSSGAIQTVVVCGPENFAGYHEFAKTVATLSKAKKLVWLQSTRSEHLDALAGDVALIPMKSYVEKPGTYVNFAGRKQTVKAVVTVVPQALSLIEAVAAFQGDAVQIAPLAHDQIGQGRVHNEFTSARGTL
jgi:NADH-quinone oxidoreductase subunit G